VCSQEFPLQLHPAAMQLVQSVGPQVPPEPVA
jgi:hypothetical protein